MTQVFVPGQKVYLLFWRRPEDSKFDRVQIYMTKRRRDDGNIDLLTYGLITLTGEWEIPLPFSRHVKEMRLTPTCPKCGAPLEKLHYGDKNDEWVCPNHCGSTLDEVMKQAEKTARDVLGDEGIGV